MFIPLHDVNPMRSIRVPYVNYALIMVSVIVFVAVQSGWLSEGVPASAASFGMIPIEFYQHIGLRDTYAVVPEPFTLLTYVFIHGSWMHLIGNLLFLWVFGDNIEDDMGHLRYLIFFFVCGVGAALTHAAMAPNSEVPLVGASGAIAGVVAAYVILHPKAKMWVLVLMRLPLKLSVIWVVAAWLVFQVVMLFMDTDQTTAWWAHLGGFVTGALLTPAMRRPGVPLFDRGLVTPEAGPLR